MEMQVQRDCLLQGHSLAEDFGFTCGQVVSRRGRRFFLS